MGGKPMLPYERQEELLSSFSIGKILHPEDIVQKYGVSIATARRDLAALAKMPNIQKVYGGAVMLAPEPTDYPLEKRKASFIEEKDRIGRYCADIVRDGDLVLLDNGTTPPYVAKHLRNREVTVLTNSLLVVQELTGGKTDILILGGHYKPEQSCITGYETIKELNNYNIAFSFLSTSGFSTDGFSDFKRGEIELKKTAISRSLASYIICDHSKYGFVAPHRACSLADVNGIITDAGLPADAAALVRNAGANLILV